MADHRGGPRLYRADRVAAATLTDEPVRRRAGVELADVWEVLRRQVEERPAGVLVTARVRRSRLDMLLRLRGPQLTGPPSDGDPATVEFAFPDVRAARGLLGFGTDVEVIAPRAAREELARAAAEAVALYADATDPD